MCYVRGKHTRNRMLELGIHCPERYGDPYLLLSNLYHPNNVEVVGNRIGIIIAGTATIGETNSSSTHEYLVLSYDTMTREQLVNGILSCSYVISECLKGVILAHAYGKKALWYSTKTQLGMFPQFIEFLDYYSGVLPPETNSDSTTPCLKDPLTITNSDVEAYRRGKENDVAIYSIYS